MKKLYLFTAVLIFATSCSSGPTACECYEGYRGETRVLQVSYERVCGYGTSSVKIPDYEACFDKFYPELKGKRGTYEEIHSILKNECGKTAWFDTGSDLLPFLCEE